jgi:hypothetical protein
MIDRVKVSKEFPSASGNTWIGFEASVEPGQQPDEVFNDIVRLIEVCNGTTYEKVVYSPEPTYQIGDDAARDEILNKLKKR